MTLATHWVIDLNNIRNAAIHPCTSIEQAEHLATSLNTVARPFNFGHFYVIVNDADTMADLCERNGIDADKYMAVG